MVAIGVGGTLVEVINEIAWRRLPVTKADIDAMIDDMYYANFSLLFVALCRTTGRR
jgi:hypothetical protein